VVDEILGITAGTVVLVDGTGFGTCFGAGTAIGSSSGPWGIALTRVDAARAKSNSFIATVSGQSLKNRNDWKLKSNRGNLPRYEI
jgi:hypothetical protein